MAKHVDHILEGNLAGHTHGKRMAKAVRAV